MSEPSISALNELLDEVDAWVAEGLGTCHGIERTNYPDAWESVIDHVRVIAHEMGRPIVGTHDYESDPEDASCDRCGRPAGDLIHEEVQP